MQAIGLCRFSYPAIGGFQVKHEEIDERIAYLYEDARLEERFRLFDTVALPCLRAQTDPDFSLIIVIGDQFPAHHEARLEAMIQDVPQAILHKEPPRNQREVMKEILNDARIHREDPCLQFRYDDDDAVSVDFIAKLRATAKMAAPLLKESRTVAMDWNRGYVAEFGAEGISATAIHRQFYVASLGMLIRGRAAVTIMNFGHEKIPQFMPCITNPEPDMFVRSHNSSNDSRQQAVAAMPVTPLTVEQEQLFRDRFAIDADRVREVFSGS